jgi:hypothetical protein
VSTTQASDVAGRFLDALERRDFVGVADTFAPNGKLRALVPATVREAEGREAIAERFRMWNGEYDEFEVLETSVESFADLLRVRWRIAGIDPQDGSEVYEQTAFVEVGIDGIAVMNLVCSGRRPAN